MIVTTQKQLAKEMGLKQSSTIAQYLIAGMPYIHEKGRMSFDVEACKAWRASLPKGSLNTHPELYGYKTTSLRIETREKLAVLSKHLGLSMSKTIAKLVDEAIKELD